ncbi:hypothetical protein LINGRAPRIM_LOCUS3434 [Linum grandiflorum]
MMDEEDDPLCPSILFTTVEKLCFRKEWRSALVVKGLVRRIPYLLLARRLNSLWAMSGNLQISNLNNGCFLVRFRAKEDYEIAVTGGPWMLGETYLTVHRWHKGFNPWDSTITKTLMWIQLPDLQVEFYHPEAVMRITSRIGKPVRVDRATKEGAPAKYARVCVEVNLTRPLLSKFKIEGIRYFIGYEGLNDLCTHCGKYGAPTNRCTCRSPPLVMDPMMDSNTNKIPIPDKETEATYGTWMIQGLAISLGINVGVYRKLTHRVLLLSANDNNQPWFQTLFLFDKMLMQTMNPYWKQDHMRFLLHLRNILEGSLDSLVNMNLHIM